MSQKPIKPNSKNAIPTDSALTKAEIANPAESRAEMPEEAFAVRRSLWPLQR
jgi:hypothetical protein